MSDPATTTTVSSSANNGLLEKLGLLLVALVVLRVTRVAMTFAYRSLFGGHVDFLKCGKWAGT